MRLRNVHVLMISLLIGVTMLGGTPAEAQTMQLYFPQTNQWVEGLFLQYWNNNGKIPVFGFPISCEGSQLIEDTQGYKYFTVQWFERFRMENHVNDPGLNPVELGRMGLEVLASENPPRANLSTGWVQFSPEPPKPGCDYYPPFGQNLCDPFRSAWKASGRLAQNGYPVSGKLYEMVWDSNPANSKHYDLQWFERARFEIHTNWPPNAQVGRGLLGNSLYFNGGNPNNTPKVTVLCGVSPSNLSLARFSERGINTKELALEDTVLYGQDELVAELFTPAANLPSVAADALVTQIKQGDLDLLNRRPLGALTIVHSRDQRLAPDDFVLTITPKGEIMFAGKDAPQLAATVYNLPQPLSRPAAFVTATQKCIAWNKTKICADSPAQQSDAILERLTQAVDELKKLREDLRLDQIDINQAVALVAGAAELNSCANGLKGDQARYDNCRALVIAAPAVKDGAFSAPEEHGLITGIGIIMVLDKIREEVFADPELTKPLDTLPSGAYLVYDVQVDTARKLADGTRVTSVRLSGTQGDFYLPAVNGVLLSGERVYGAGPATQAAAVTASLILRNRCFIRAGRCPGQLK